MVELSRNASSFRDPNGFVFERDGELYRQVNVAYRPHYDHLMASGLAGSLTDAGLLIAHEEVDAEAWQPEAAYRILRPERVPFVSYPYEWCFSQWRDAALLTLEVQERALGAEMSLKDASAYNVQFRGARPVFIDTLSFELYEEGRPWVAYRQFCQHFLAPLALWSRVDSTLGRLMRTNIDGVPLELASRLLPWRTWLNPDLLIHVHLHARLQRKYSGSGASSPREGFSRRSMRNLLASLRAAIEKLRWAPRGGTAGWAEYTRECSYSDAARGQKRELVKTFLDRIKPGVVWDLGANTGEYSRVAADRGATTIAIDLDPACVERNYREAAARGDAQLLPLVMDLSNPSPAIGWQHQERMSLLDRGPADAVMALALAHHLAIAHNVPLTQIADFLQKAGRWLIVEFVPKDDPQARRLLASRDDIFDTYDRGNFEAAFRNWFAIESAESIADSGRTLYLMRRSA